MKNKNKEFTSLNLHFSDKDRFQVASTYSAFTHSSRYSYTKAKVVTTTNSALVQLVDNNGMPTGYRYEGHASYFSRLSYEKIDHYYTTYQLQPRKIQIIN